MKENNEIDFQTSNLYVAKSHKIKINNIFSKDKIKMEGKIKNSQVTKTMKY
jgi:hypothetical protein